MAGALGVAREWLACFNDGERDAFRARLAPDVVFVQRAREEEARGLERVDESFWSWRARFLGLHGEVTDAFGAGDRAAIEVCWTGIALEVEREVTFRACLLFSVHDGRIERIVDYYDQLSFLRQLR